MSRKKRKQTYNKEFLGIVIILIAILSIISLFSDKTGVIGKLLRSIYLQLMGFGGYVFPLIVLLIGILLVLNRFNVDEDKKSLYFIIIFLCFLVIIDMNVNKQTSFLDKINFSLKFSKQGLGGGFIGAILGYIFFKLFGTIGTYVILSFVILLNIIMITEIKIKDILKKRPKISKKTNSKPIIINDDFKKEQKPKETKMKDVKILDYRNNNKNKKKNIIDKNDNDYKKPSLQFLKDVELETNINDKKEILLNAKKIEDTMKSFGIKAHVVQINKGPTITCYELEPAPGVKVSKIVNLSDDIALNLATSDVRIEAPIPGKSVVGIEVPNKIKSKVVLKEILVSEEYRKAETKVPLALGKDISGKSIVSSIEKMPHLLIAGATGSGKSVCINSIIMSILYRATPKEVKMLLIDPKVVELSVYNDIPHLLIPVVTDAKKATAALNWAVGEMERRYKLFAEENVRDIKSYNKNYEENDEKYLPQIVIVIDELADLMTVSAQEIEDYICRLAQMARAAGMYLIVATQRPSVDVITGTIKANIPSRISFAVTSQTDSRTILDMNGAEKLLGKGDMLFYPSDIPKPIRVQGAYIDDEEVEKVVEFLKSQNTIDYEENIIETIETKKEFIDETNDELLPDAISLVVDQGQASISLLQRKLKIGYARAARLIDEMEERGIVGGFEGNKPRKVLIDKEDLDL